MWCLIQTIKICLIIINKCLKLLKNTNPTFWIYAKSFQVKRKHFKCTSKCKDKPLKTNFSFLVWIVQRNSSHSIYWNSIITNSILNKILMRTFTELLSQDQNNLSLNRCEWLSKKSLMKNDRSQSFRFKKNLSLSNLNFQIQWIRS